MTTKDEIKRAIKEADQELRAERRKRRAAGELATTTFGIFGGLGFLAGFLPRLLPGTLGIFLIGAGILFLAMTLIIEVRAGRSLPGVILLTLAVTVLPFLLTYGIMWYFMVYLTHSGQPLFTFPKPN